MPEGLEHATRLPPTRRRLQPHRRRRILHAVRLAAHLRRRRPRGRLPLLARQNLALHLLEVDRARAVFVKGAPEHLEVGRRRIDLERRHRLEKLRLVDLAIAVRVPPPEEVGHPEVLRLQLGQQLLVHLHFELGHLVRRTGRYVLLLEGGVLLPLPGGGGAAPRDRVDACGRLLPLHFLDARQHLGPLLCPVQLPLHLAEIDRARAVAIEDAPHGIHLVVGHLDLERRHRAHKLGAAHLPVSVFVPLPEQIHHASLVHRERSDEVRGQLVVDGADR